MKVSSSYKRSAFVNARKRDFERRLANLVFSWCPSRLSLKNCSLGESASVSPGEINLAPRSWNRHAGPPSATAVGPTLPDAEVAAVGALPPACDRVRRRSAARVLPACRAASHSRSHCEGELDCSGPHTDPPSGTHPRPSAALQGGHTRLSAIGATSRFSRSIADKRAKSAHES